MAPGGILDTFLKTGAPCVKPVSNSGHDCWLRSYSLCGGHLVKVPYLQRDGYACLYLNLLVNIPVCTSRRIYWILLCILCDKRIFSGTFKLFLWRIIWSVYWSTLFNIDLRFANCLSTKQLLDYTKIWVMKSEFY